MYLIGFFITFSLIIIGITVLCNLLFFPRLHTEPFDKSSMVSVLIPARNETAVIGRTVEQVLAQTGINFELLLLDDGSRDGTPETARQAAQGDVRFHLIDGQSLPPGWLGKNWACHQLSEAARGDLLLFLDADVQLKPGALAALAGYITRENAGLVTVWPTQITHSWGERLVVPLIAFAILGYLPILPVHYTPWHAFAAANGQCLLFTRSVYEQSGGHAAVRQEVIEDVALARRVKTILSSKLTKNKAAPPAKSDSRIRSYFSSPLRMADGNQLLCCQMYPGGWPQVRDGFSKNILAGHANNIPFLLLSTIFHWLVFIVPWIWLIFGGGWWALGLGLTGILLRALTAAFTHQRVLDAFLMPLSVMLMTDIARQAITWHTTGTATWKGRPV